MAADQVLQLLNIGDEVMQVINIKVQVLQVLNLRAQVLQVLYIWDLGTAVNVCTAGTALRELGTTDDVHCGLDTAATVHRGYVLQVLYI